jgi:dihydroorotase-like cyclic amidohydrolase
MTMDMIVRDARFVDRDGRWEISVEDGRIADVVRGGRVPARNEIERSSCPALDNRRTPT